MTQIVKPAFLDEFMTKHFCDACKEEFKDAFHLILLKTEGLLTKVPGSEGFDAMRNL